MCSPCALLWGCLKAALSESVSVWEWHIFCELLLKTWSPHYESVMWHSWRTRVHWADALGRGQCTPIARGVSLLRQRGLTCSASFVCFARDSCRQIPAANAKWKAHCLCLFGVVAGPALAVALSTSVTRWSLWLRLRVTQSGYAAHVFIILTCTPVTGYLLFSQC